MMKRLLSLLIASIFIGNIATAMTNQQHGNSSSIASDFSAIASKTLDEINTINPDTHFASLPDDCKEILYNEIFKQAQRRWPRATWNDSSILKRINHRIFQLDRLEAVSPDDNTAASCTITGYVKIRKRSACGYWLTDNRFTCLNGGHHCSVDAVMFSPDSNTLVTGSYDKTIKIYQKNDSRHWNITQTLDSSNGGHDDPVTSMVFSPDGNTLVSASLNGTVKFYQRDVSGNWNIIQTLDGIYDTYNGIASLVFNYDGNTLASCSWDSTIKIYQKYASGHWNIIQILDNTDKSHPEIFGLNDNILVCISDTWDVKIYKRNASGNWNILQTFTSRGDKSPWTLRTIAFGPDSNIFVTELSYDKVKIDRPHNFGSLEYLLAFIKTLPQATGR